MKIQPYRIIDNEKEDSLAELYEIIIIGEKPYRVLLEIDELNDKGLVSSSCTCPDFKFRKNNYCKHIEFAIEVLSDFGIGAEDG